MQKPPPAAPVSALGGGKPPPDAPRLRQSESKGEMSDTCGSDRDDGEDGSTPAASDDTGSGSVKSTHSSTAAQSGSSDATGGGGSRKSARSWRTDSGSHGPDGEELRGGMRAHTATLWLGALLGAVALVLFAIIHGMGQRPSVSEVVCPPDKGCATCEVRRKFPDLWVALASVAFFFLLVSGPTLTIMRRCGARRWRLSGPLLCLEILAIAAVAFLTVSVLTVAYPCGFTKHQYCQDVYKERDEEFFGWCREIRDMGIAGLSLFWVACITSCGGQVAVFRSHPVVRLPSATDPETYRSEDTVPGSASESPSMTEPVSKSDDSESLSSTR
jgi:hypothetical protein